MARTALVTGSTRGIGKAIALRLLRDGFAVALNYDADEAAAGRALAEARVINPETFAVRADAATPAGCDRLMTAALDRLGRLDVLVNNIGPWLVRPLAETGDPEWRRMIDGNLGSAFWCARGALPSMRARRSGCIVNVGALNVETSAGMTYEAPAYFAAKSGLMHLTRALASSEGPFDIRVNAVNPGFIETENYARLDPGERDHWIGRIPLRRFGRPEDVAEAVAFLVSDRAAYVSGTVLHVHGGLWI